MTAMLGLAAMTVVIGAIMMRLTRDVTFFGRDTDNGRYTRAAAAMRWFDWPSSLNRLTDGKAPMKLFFVVLLAAVQRLLPRHARESERPVVMLCILSNCASVLLLYGVARSYWGAGPAALVAGLLLVSLWPWQVAIFGGPVCLAQTCFLASVALVQLAATNASAAGIVGWVAVGAAAALTQFASSSARKYLPLLFAACIEAEWRLAASDGPGLGAGPLVAAALAVSAGLVAGFTRYWIPALVEAAYGGRGPGWLVAIVGGAGRKSIEHYRARTGAVLRVFTKWTFIVMAYLVLGVLVFPPARLLGHHAAVLAGFIAVALWLTLPDLVPNLRRYLYFVNAQRIQGSRFESYRDVFARRGIAVPRGMRGGGVRWLVRFFPRIAPVESAAYGFAVLAILADVVRGGFEAGSLARAALIIVLSLSPTAVAELSGAPQISRTYFPGLIGLSVAIAEAAWRLERWAGAEGVMAAAVVTVGLAVAVNAWTFFGDVWPARMASARLAARLASLPATRVYTYDTVYNDAFLDTIPADVRARLDVRYIRSLDEVEDGWVVVPATSAKSMTMEGYPEARDFTDDEALNRLLASREIERVAVASFPTMGSSRIWVHEAEVTSYRDLILREVGEADRWRGRGWILDGSRLKAEREGRSVQWTTGVGQTP